MSDVDDWVDDSVDASVVVEPVNEPLAVVDPDTLDWLARVIDPSVVGADSVLGTWSMGADTLTTTGRAADRPEAVGATVAAMLEAEPQPYWKLPPSNWFR